MGKGMKRRKEKEKNGRKKNLRGRSFLLFPIIFLLRGFFFLSIINSP